MAYGRLNSRIRAVAPAFPAQGPANLAGTLAGRTLRPIRLGPEPRVRSKLHAQLQDVPQRALVLAAPFTRARDAGGSSALGPGGDIVPAVPPTGTTPPGSPGTDGAGGGCGCGCG